MAKKPASTFNMTAPITDQMRGAGIDWSGVKAYAVDAINLLQNHGDLFKGMICLGFKAFTQVTGHDYAGIIASLSEAQVDVQAVIAAIKLEFHLE